ncbi:MAG TPA: type III pantothenate kinase [Tepidisphaeraceae bacterium]|nr:type III pantothenate kinase [Tepidisphaeraceae bacterium]
MDINLMVLNVGNTRLSIGVFVAGELTYSARVPHAQRGEWAARLGEAWEQIRDLQDPAVAAAGVNPPLIEPLEHAAERATGKKVEWVGPDLDLPIKVLTDEPARTGVDRVLNVAAAYEQMGKACVVVDAGTAITVDCCNDKGEFLGGAIAPGVAMQLEALHEKTAALPRVELAVPDKAFGTSTAAAIQLGVYHGVRGTVKELVEAYATALGNWPDVIATGGDAPVLFEGWELIHAIAPDLTLYGIALAYTNHHIKHGS